MKTKALLDQIKPPESLEEVLEVVRCGAGVQVSVRPRLSLDKTAPDRNHPSLRLSGVFAVKFGDRTASFEKAYAKGHEVWPAKAAANGFLIANTRLTRDLKRMRQAGVKCDGAPFILDQMLPDTEFAEFEPHKPYNLNQFALLASIGRPLQVSMTTYTRAVSLEAGVPGQELCAMYSIQYQGQGYQVETRHGRFASGADAKEIDQLLEWSRHRLLTEEQYNLRRVGVEILMGPLWPGEKDTRLSAVPSGFVAGDEKKEADQARQSLRAV